MESIVERVAALHRVTIFADVPGRTLAAVAREATESVVDEGTTFIEEGNVEDHLFVIVAGRVRVHNGPHLLIELGPGDTVGELAALLPEPRSASVTALEPTTLLRVDKTTLDQLIAERPALANGVITGLVRSLRARRADGSGS